MDKEKKRNSYIIAAIIIAVIALFAYYEERSFNRITDERDNETAKVELAEHYLEDIDYTISENEDDPETAMMLVQDMLIDWRRERRRLP